MFQFKLAILLLLVQVFIVAAIASPAGMTSAEKRNIAHPRAFGARSSTGMTNAQRLARGLPPLRPRKLFDASHVDSAARSKRSVAPNTQFSCTGNKYAACCTGLNGINGVGCQVNTATVTYNTCTSGQTAYCCEGGVTGTTPNAQCNDAIAQ